MVTCLGPRQDLQGGIPGSGLLSLRGSKPLQGSLLNECGQIFSLIFYPMVTVAIGEWHLGRGENGRE